MNLDGRIRGLQGDLMPSPPISDSPTAGLVRVPVTKEDETLPLAQPGDVVGTGGQDKPTPIGSQDAVAGVGGAVEADPLRGSVDNNNTLPQPTPVDNTPQLIEDRRQQALEALKAEGFDGYTPDVNAISSVDDQHSVAKAVTDIAAGFNISLARALSLPRETVDRGLGMLGLDYMQHGSPQQNTVDALNRMGIPAYEVENLANKIGKGALPALATWAAMQLAAPSMAANQGVGTLGYLMREVGQWTMKHPVVGMWLGQASQAGGKVATDTFGDNPAIEFAGELAGGAAPGAAKFAVSKVPGVKPLTKAVGAGINAISDVLPTDLSNAVKKYNPLYSALPPASSKTPLIDAGADANRIQTFAKDQIFAAQTYQDKAIENAINSIPTSGTPAQVQTRTHNLLEQAEKISKRIVSGFWDRVPLKTKIPVTDLRNDVIAMRRELVDSDNVRPDTMLDKVMDVVRLRQEPGSGKFVAPKPTIQKLRDLQSQIGTAITEERARDAPREGMVRNLARLSEVIDENIAKQLPNNTTIEQARQMSKRHNDLFSRGPINDILSKRRTGDFRVPVADSVDTLLQKTDGLAALKAVQEGVSTYPRIPTTRFLPAAQRGRLVAVTPQEEATLNQLVKSAEDSIRASFREAAEAGPEKAVAYSQKNEDAIKALANVAGELNFAAQKVAAVLAEKKAIQSSALARFAETSPEKAVQNIFAQKDPAAVARQLMISFRGDPDAIEGLRNQILNELIFNKAKANPVLVQRMMKEPRTQNLLEATLSNDQWNRLKKMTDTAVRVGVEDETGWRTALKSPFKTLGQFIGAAAGRKLNTGTIQVPGIFSKRFGAIMERSLGGTDPQDLLAQAVLDPHWERLLYSRVPTNSRDMRLAQDNYRRIFSTIDTSYHQTLRRLSEDKDDE
jgi:hypothetical protein